MLHQPVLGSFQPVPRALVTTGTHITPLTVLPSLYQQCFPSTSTTRICTYRRNNSLPATAQHFHTRPFCHPAPVCSKCHPALSWFTYEYSLLYESSHLWMCHIESKGVMLPLNVSCYLWNILWSLKWHLWISYVIVVHVIIRKLRLYIYVV